MGLEIIELCEEGVGDGECVFDFGGGEGFVAVGEAFLECGEDCGGVGGNVVLIGVGWVWVGVCGKEHLVLLGCMEEIVVGIVVVVEIVVVVVVVV